MTSVYTLANAFSQALAHGCAIYDDEMIARISSISALQAGWKFFGVLNNQESQIKGLEGWTEGNDDWSRPTLNHTTGSGRLKIVVGESVIYMTFTAGTGDVVLSLSIRPADQKVDVLHLRRDLIVGREDRLDSLHRFNAHLGGLLGDWLTSSRPEDRFLRELIGGSDSYRYEEVS